MNIVKTGKNEYAITGLDVKDIEQFRLAIKGNERELQYALEYCEKNHDCKHEKASIKKEMERVKQFTKRFCLAWFNH